VSYDLFMFSPEPDADPMDTLERLEEREEAATPDPGIAERNRRIANALLAMNSNYTESEIRFDVIAEQADSLDSKYLADEIARASKVIGEATGWRLYDPQLGKFIDPVRDADEFAEAFGVGVRHVHELLRRDRICSS
jgi:hypothetical protein